MKYFGRFKRISWSSTQTWRLLSWWLVLACGIPSAFPKSSVAPVRTPEDGIQPQVWADGSGLVRLIFYRGDARAGDVYYQEMNEDGVPNARPIRVNSISGTAVAVGTIRGPQMAVGKNGRVHVVWNGGQSAPATRHGGAPFFYTRSNEHGPGFEPQRDLMTFTEALDGGGSVASDGAGRVWAIWHARKPDSVPGEAGRRVYLAQSRDGGKTFSKEKPISPPEAGACGCCGLKGLAAPDGTVSILFRSAVQSVHRDELWLDSRDGGRNFVTVLQHPWETPACPMSSASLSNSADGILGAWETAGQVYFASLEPGSMRLSAPIHPPGQAQRKHPVAIANGRGEVLLVWAEGTGWEKGGALVWQLFKDGLPEGAPGKIERAIPVWSMAAAFAKQSGDFVIVY